MQNFGIPLLSKLKGMKQKQLSMKLTAFFLMAAFLQVNAKTYPQNISISVKKAPVEDVFKQIEAQSDYRFFYNEKLLKNAKKLTFSFKEVSIETVLKKCVEEQTFTYAIDNRLIIMKEKVSLPENKVADNTLALPRPPIVITGTVTDENGKPLEGVNVLVKETKTGISTDANGVYKIDISDAKSAVLVFSFVGMETQEIKVENSATLHIKLKGKETTAADVIVVGYGTARKRDLTGAVASADMNAFKQSANVNVFEKLKGSVPGLNISQVTAAGSEPQLSIRGINSISGTSTPLIVLDGIIFRGSLSGLNPNDLESINVLKDASATAIYGSQAANGVILMTTKMGTTGDKPIISFNASYTSQSPTKVLRPLNSPEFRQKNMDADWRNSYLGPDYTTPNPNYQFGSFLSNTSKDNFLAGIDNSWWDLATVKNPSISDFNLGVRNKNKFTSYLFSLGYTNQQNLIVGDKYKRTTARINIETIITNWLTVGVRSYLAYNDYSGVSPNLRQIFILPNYEKAFDSTGNIILAPHWGFELSPLLNKRMSDKEKQIDLNGTFTANVKIPWVNGLSYRFNGSIIGNLYNHFSFNQWGLQFTGVGYKNSSTTSNWTADNIITYNRDFNKDHRVNVTLLYGIEKRSNEGSYLQSADFSNPVLGYNRLQAGSPSTYQVSTSAWDEASLYSMARLFYSFKNKYMLTGTIRRDGFSGFGVNNKFGVFPSGALAWVVSEEDFAKNLKWLSSLKLRASYGINGNRTIGRYQTLAPVLAQIAYSYGNGAPVLGQYVNGVANPNLKWEKTAGLNIGADFSILNSRIFGNIEYYQTKTKDLLYTVNIPVINGFNTVSSNIGELKNHGVEFVIGTKVMEQKDIHWTVTANFSLNRDKIVSLIEKKDIASNNLFIGKPLNVWYDYKINGMWQLADEVNGNIPAGFSAGTWKLADLDKSGTITADKDRQILGNLSPGYRFGIKNEVSYKNWNLMVFINSIQGGRHFYYGNISPQEAGWSGGDNLYNYNMPKWDWWTPRNPNATYQMLGARTPVNTTLYMQRNFVRLQNVSLSYTLNSELLNKTKIRNLTAYISGYNLITFTKWRGWDPETGIGLQTNAMPVMKNFSIGFNAEF